jgi:filamentous hemagglutinin family protein
VAQLTPDNTLGAEASLVNPGVDIGGQPGDRIEGGARRGVNLFHSFSNFNVNSGQRVYFANPTGVNNILTRVTGTSVSNILGTLGVDGTANLFLLNPNGILFGPNAQLDVRGSFVASTGDRFVFSNGSEFSAVNPQAPPLLTISITPGLQYGRPVGNINNAGTLTVAPGQSLTLFGNTVTHTGRLMAPGGLVQVFGNRVSLLDNAQIDVAAPGGGGTILIGGDFQGKGSVPNATDTFVGSGVVLNADAIANGNGGRVIVWADETTRFYGMVSARGGNQSGNGGFVEVSGKQFLDFNGQVNTLAANGLTGTLLLDPTNITVVAGPINPLELAANNSFSTTGNSTITNGSINSVGAFTNVILQATNDIIFNAVIFINGTGTGLIAQAGNSIAVNQSITTGSGGTLQLIAGSASGSPTSSVGTIIIRPGVFVRANTGNLLLQANGEVIVDNAQVSTYAATAPGNSGTLTIETGRLVLQNNGQLVSGSNSSANGNNINIRANQVELLDSSSIFTDGATGNAGNVTIEAQRLLLQDQAGIYAGTFGPGQGGDITLRVAQIELLGSRLSDFGIFTSSNLPTSTGNAGNITIQTQQLTVRNGRINSVTSGTGNAGNLTIQAAAIELFNSQLNSGAANFRNIPSGGNGGNLSIETGRLSLNNGSEISVSNAGLGNAGNLDIRALEFVNLTSSKIGADAVLGQGGKIFLDAGNLTLQNGSTISSITLGTQPPGDITLKAQDSITLNNRSLIQAAGLSPGGGGNISLATATGSLLLQGQSVILSTTVGQGNSGSINANIADQIVVSNSSQLSTLSVSTGKSGDLTIAAGSLRVSEGSQISTTTVDPQIASPQQLQLDLSNSQDQLIWTIISNARNAGVQPSTEQGASGNLTINLKGAATIEGISALTTLAYGRAGGGSLSLQADSLAIDRAGFVSSQSQSGQAGNITLNLANTLQTDAGIITAASFESGGGNIIINASDTRLRNSSLISSSVFDSVGGGGNITIRSGVFLALEDSDILANAEAGPGGNIFINSSAFLADFFATGRATAIGRNPGSFAPFRGNGRVDISAESRSGQSGVVKFPRLDPERGVSTLPDEPREPQLDEVCARFYRISSDRNEFTFVGRGGLPPDPETPISGDGILAGWVSMPSETFRRTPSVAPQPEPPAAIVEAQGIVVDAEGNVTLVAYTDTGMAQINSFIPQSCP